GNKKHGTKHNEYVCYNQKCPNYNKVVDRDKNAMLSLLALTEHPELNHAL
ncbi:RNA-guided endonuclease TnpB family protein, partial [Lactobacillus delbrueckii subsp. bulgaricus]|nr:transposase [Lactobacillus delbrueckii subsp. bulgaricus]